MKYMGVNELRRSYLEFFESKGHLRMNSFSLIPQNDKSLLLINAGMTPLKPYFTGQEIPPRKRVTTCQKCIRTGDIDNVGKTARHLTFFEMLGNFSFGDYFKKEAIAWSWEFLTKVLEMDPNLLYPSIYGEDEEAFEIWTKDIGIAPEKITRFYRDADGKCDNFWEHGAGPCGPCSEIYYDRGAEHGCGSPDCKVGCECDRFMEVWNNVFTQFDGDGKGNYTELASKNIDTGMGLERLATVVQSVDSVYEIDTMKAIRNKVCEISGKKFGENKKLDESIFIITDHIRSVTFMTSDGVIPSNEGRGYVLRRLIRRACRHGRLLGITKPFISDMCQVVINESRDGYPELEEKREYILKVLSVEEEKFNRTIDQGLSILSEMIEQLGSKRILSGDDAFKLYDTYGFPIDLTIEILDEKGFTVDMDGFAKAMKIQKDTARSARAVTNYMGADATVYDEIPAEITSVFTGYDSLSGTGMITALTTETELTDEIVGGQNATIITDKTPFYATMGGQAADIGMIRSGASEFTVVDTIKLKGNKIGHVGTVTAGSFHLGDVVTMEVEDENRAKTCKNHSATHLLQKALRLVLGSHVEQAGSFVSADRLRFDFTHFSAMTTEEVSKVEELVNQEIENNLPVVTDVMNIEEARKSGAMALFGEKYAEKVRVVSMGDFSKELCGGTHVKNTGVITAFKILSESGIAAGVRRIEAITSSAVFEYYKQMEADFQTAAKAAKTEPGNLVHRINSLQEELKTALSENEKLKAKLANQSMGDVMNQVTEVKGVRLLATKISDVDMNGLRNLGDQLKEKLGEGVVVLLSSMDGKVSLLVMATDDAVEKGAHAGNIVKELAVLVGGGGGGRPNMAQAGGKNPDGIDAAIAKAAEVLSNQVK